MRVLALSSYDSFLNTARIISPYFERAGCEVEFAVVKARSALQISETQIRTLTSGVPTRWVDIVELCASGEIAQYDIVLACLEGLSTRRMMHHMIALGERRPLIVTAYPGLVLRYPFDGFSMRSGSDLLWLNCRADVDAFVSMARTFGMTGDNARLFGVAALLQPIARDAAAAIDGPVVFFEQAIIPRYHDERLFLAEQLVRLARRHPGRAFIVKPRTRAKEATLHRAWHPIEPLMHAAARALGGWPANLTVTSHSATRLLSKASHCLTVCSTVAAEAMHAGVPTVIIGDFGAHDDYGLHYFYGSGLIRTFAELEFPFTATADPGWRSRFIGHPGDTIEALVAEAVNRAAGPRQPLIERPMRAEMSPELRSYMTQRNGAASVVARRYQKQRTWRTVSINAVLSAWRAVRSFATGRR